MAKKPRSPRGTSKVGAAASSSSKSAADSPVAAAYAFPSSPVRAALAPEVLAETKRVFQRLAEQWKASRGPASTVKKRAQHPAYKEIIGLGEPAIPLLLEELDREPDHWFAALLRRQGRSSNTWTDGPLVE